MSSQIERPHGYGYEQEPQNAGSHVEGQVEHQPEKKSVLKKVKAKAKKLKDTLNLHGHGQGHDQDHLQHVPDDHDLDEEDDEEMVDDTAIHDGASALGSSVPGQVGKLGDSETYYGRSADKKDSSLEDRSFFPKEDKGLKVSVGKTSNIKEVPRAPLNTPASIASENISGQTRNVDPIESLAREQEVIQGQPEVYLEGPDLVEDPDAPKNRPEGNIPSNYQTKVTDPMGARGEEIEVDSIIGSLDKVNVSEESKIPTRHLDRSIFPTESYDQYSPEPTPPLPIASQETSEVQEHPDHETADKASKQGSYTGKISAATSVIADKAIAASNVVVSKLGYGGRDNAKEHEMHEGRKQAKLASPTEYSKKIAATVTEKFSPVYGRVAETGKAVMFKVGVGTGNEAESNIKGQDEGVTVKHYLTEKLKPGEEDKALSEIISEALHKQKPEDEKKDKPIAKVTESEDVKRRLGSSDENSEEKKVDPGSVHAPGSAVVDKIKGVVGQFSEKA